MTSTIVYFNLFFYAISTTFGLSEEGMTVPELIRHNGYPLEIHKPITEDGYELSIHRIPYGRVMTKDNKTVKASVNRPPVFLQHGLMGSASCWLTNSPENSLAFILADNGFDVWLGNVRGNRYSAWNTKSMRKWNQSFWDFSWQDMAKYDIPAMINYVLKETNFDNISYIGHSQGTLIGFAQLSEDKEFAKKINLFVALAPVARVGNIKSKIRRQLAPGWNQIKNMLDAVRQYSLESINEYLDHLRSVCKYRLMKFICNRLVIKLMGEDFKKNLNKERIPVYLSNNPENTSVKNFAHFAQMVNSGKMQKYDYGVTRNIELYRQESPPEYNLTNIQVSTVVFWSTKDALTNTADVEWLLSELKMPKLRVYEFDDYAHLDFLWAKDVNERIYQKIVNMLKNSEE